MITFMIRTRNVQNKLLNSISFKWKLLIKLTDNKLAKTFRQDAASRNVLMQSATKNLQRFYRDSLKIFHTTWIWT